MKFTFNSLGVLINTQIEPVRQGDTNHILEAEFADINNANFVCYMNLTRPDGKKLTNKQLTPSVIDPTKFSVILDSAWLFALSGETTLTVFLVNGAEQTIANGQATFGVEKTDFSDEDVVLDPDDYEELLGLIARKLDITSGIMKANTRTALGNLTQYTNGQVFFVRADENKSDHKTLLQLQSGILNPLFDFDDVKSGIISDVEVEQEITTTKIIYTVNLLNSAEEVVASFEIELPSATITQAGLMSASDKNKLDDLPTGSEIEETYQTKEDAEEEHGNLQEQIDAIISKSDVVDVVGTHAELEDYDTSKLGNNDIIKVLVDETKNNQRSYYRWLKDDEEFEYVGSEGEFYTKSESDQLFLKKVDAETKYQHKVKVMNTIPTTDDLEENEIAVVPSVEDLGETIIGDGLELTTDAQTGVKTLKTSQSGFVNVGQNLVINANQKQIMGYKFGEEVSSGDYVYRVLQDNTTSQPITDIERIKDYMEFMTGNRTLPVYNVDKPESSFIILDNGTMWKYQYQNNVLLAFKVQNIPFAKKSDIKKYYRHNIAMILSGSGTATSNIFINIVSDKSDAYNSTTLINFLNNKGSIVANGVCITAQDTYFINDFNVFNEHLNAQYFSSGGSIKMDSIDELDDTVTEL